MAAIASLLPSVWVRAQTPATTVSASDGYRRQFARATILQARGDQSIALEAFGGISSAADASPVLRQAARRRAIAIQLRDAPQTSDALKEVERLTADGTDPADTWNWTCRILFAQVKAASPSQRAQVWQRGLTRLATESVAIEEPTIRDLDVLLASLGREGSLRPLDVLTDLALLTPDSRSLRYLLSRRCDVLSEMGDSRGNTVARTLVLLSACSDSDLLNTVAKLRGIETSGEGRSLVPTTAQSRFAMDCLTRRGGATVDAQLEQAAANALKDSESLSPRRRAYLCMFAQRPDECIAAAWLALTESGADALTELQFADLLALIAACGGDFDRACRSAMVMRSWSESIQTSAPITAPAAVKRLTSIVTGGATPGSPPVGDALVATTAASESVAINRLRFLTEVWIDGGVRWIEKAFEAGDDELALAFFMRLIEAEGDPVQVRRVIDKICPPLSFAAGTAPVRYDALIEALTAMAPVVTVAETRRSLLIRLASMHFAEGHYGRCDVLAKEVEQIRACAGDAWDAELCITRGLSLLKEDHFGLAAAQFQRVAEWPVPSAERARAGFLWAFTSLQLGEEASALAKLREVVDTYPKAPFAGKARELIARFEEF